MPKPYVKLDGDMQEKPQPPSMDAWRTTIFGDSGVGKTALARQFAHSVHQDYHDPTNSDDVFHKLLTVDNRRCFIEVIDTAGHGEYVTLRDLWAREGQAYLLVYDTTSCASFKAKALGALVEIITRAKHKPICVLVGNKADRTHGRAIARAEGARLAQTLGFSFVETSATTAWNVECAFVDVVRMLRAKRPAQRRRGGTRKRQRGMRCGGGCVVV